MPDFQNLLFSEEPPRPATRRISFRKSLLRGCSACPSNRVKGVNKIINVDAIEGRRYFIWAQSPGATENTHKKELIGRAGKLLWSIAAKVGIDRDECDIQNVMRCWPKDLEAPSEISNRDPTKEELRCCSLYTDKAITVAGSSVHIILGKIAAQQVLGKEVGKGTKSNKGKIFWSDTLRAKTIVLDHPAYLLRSGEAKHIVSAFKAGLRAAKRASKSPGKFSYIKKMDYVAITTIADAKSGAKVIRKAALTTRIASDVEDGDVKGEKRALCCGFSYKPGHAFVFILHHPPAKLKKAVRRGIAKVVKGLLEDPDVRLIFHHGSYDVQSLRKTMKVIVQGYDYDTNYAEYFKYPGRRSYALREIAAVRYPEFAGYKEIIAPEALPPGMLYKEAIKTWQVDLCALPTDKLVLYNGGDCDLTKRIEDTTKDDISLPLLHVYMDAAYTIEAMQENGPYFDYKQCEFLEQIYPPRVERLRQKVQVMAGNPDFNPNAPAQVAKVLYEQLELPVVTENGVPNTRKETLEILGRKHKFPRLMLKYKDAYTIVSRYLISFKETADEYGGRLRTIWWLTGTATGRLRSGGVGARKGRDKIVNLQNVHSDPQLKNMLVSDIGWRALYRAWKEAEGKGGWYKPFLDTYVFLAFDYAQIEIRVLAFMAQDKRLLEIFASGEDIHCQVGNELTGWSVEKIKKNKKTRTLVKNLHFGMVYGLSYMGMMKYLLANGVKLTLARVTTLMKRYFKRFKGVAWLIKELRRQAEEEGYVETPFGFRRPIEVKESEKGSKRESYWGNQAINSPIQGGAHQLMVMAMAVLKRRRNKFKILGAPQMEVHDALNFRVKLRDLPEAYVVGKELLEEAVLRVIKKDFGLKWNVPLLAEAESGFRLGVPVEFTDELGIKAFLNMWCEKNKLVERVLRKELRNL